MSAQTVERILTQHQGASRDALIPILQEVQEAEGYLSREAVIQISKHLKLPASKIYGVATFYNQFRFQPPGKHVVQVCRGTACHVNRSPAVLAALKEHLGIGEDQTTPDGEFTLQTVACLGCCSLAPVMTVQETTFGRMTPGGAVETLQKIRADEAEVAG